MKLILASASPTYGGISVGQDRNQVPREEILRRLEHHQVRTYRTDLDGDVLFTSDGTTITATTQFENDG